MPSNYRYRVELIGSDLLFAFQTPNEYNNLKLPLAFS